MPTDGLLPFVRDYADRGVPAFVAGGGAPPAEGGSKVSITIEAGQLLRTLPKALYGNNAATWVGDFLWSEAAYQRLRTANVPLLRFPGGSTADVYHWDGIYPAYVSGQAYNSESWAVSTAEYLALVERLGAISVITANHGYASYDTTKSDGKVANAARLAADWVEYCNAANDGANPNGGTDWAAKRAVDGHAAPFAVKYWEIGNEVFGNWETGYDPAGTTYAADFNVMADAMKAVDPTIAIGLVVDPTPTYEAWTKAVLANPGTAERADFLIVHTYFSTFSSATSVTPSVLLAQAGQVAELKSRLDALIIRNTTRSPASLPYYLSEYNVPGPVNPLQISLASGLFIAKVLGQLASSGWSAASLWDVMNGYDNSGSYGPGDHGFLSLRQPNVPDLTPRPTYYDFYFFTRNFGDHLVRSTSSDAMVTVHASTFTGGGVGVVVINEASEGRTLVFSISDATLAGSANAWILSGPSLAGEKVTLNGVASGLDSGGPPPESVLPYVVTTDASGSAAVDVPASSVTSIVFF